MYCQKHNSELIKGVCLQGECAKESLICQTCEDDYHDGHQSLSIPKFRASIQKYLTQSRGQQELTKEGQLAYVKMQNFLEQSSQSIYKQSQKLNKLGQFMDNLNDTLLNLQDLNEEYELAQEIITELEKNESADINQLNSKFSNLFILLQTVRMPNEETGKMELTLTPSQISQIRTKSIIDKKAEFTQEMKKGVEVQDEQFEQFLKNLGQLIKDNKQFLIPKNTQTEEQKNMEFGKKELGPYYQKLYQQQQLKVKDEQDLLNNQEHAIIPTIDEQPGDGKRQVFRLCNYLIFYNGVNCDAFLPEPILRGVPMKKMQFGELKFPIRCAFCRLLKIRSFVQFYFRFDLATRFGKLCLFKDKQGNEICAHEMCLLWSNRVVVNYDNNEIDVETIQQAVQYAQAQMCRYCGSIGASLKCFVQECHVHFHFNCLKQVKLMGLQLCHEQKYRFYCEDHVKHNYHGQSEWFITRIRMKQLVRKDGTTEQQEGQEGQEQLEQQQLSSIEPPIDKHNKTK